jgi:NitT/TauT family transport system permease protein
VRAHAIRRSVDVQLDDSRRSFDLIVGKPSHLVRPKEPNGSAERRLRERTGATIIQLIGDQRGYAGPIQIAIGDDGPLRGSPQSRIAVRRHSYGLADIAVFLGTLALLAAVARLGSGTLVAFGPAHHLAGISLDPRNLPYYAGRSVLRMFVALGASFAFTFAYGYTAARSRRAQRVLIPLLDILQSVPVLGFLSITVTGFIALFPGSLFGLECASIFAIFTSQAWNMAFSFYQSLRTLPRDLEEATEAYRLSSWQRFRQLEVPAGMIPLVWNAMMSFGGGWFFLAASEAISVLGQSYALPGVGSYVATAIAKQDLPALGWAALTMAIVIGSIDQLFWRPVVAWSDRFRLDQTSGGVAPKSWVYDLLRASRLPKKLRSALRPFVDALDQVLDRLTARKQNAASANGNTVADAGFTFVLVIVVVALIGLALHFILTTVGITEVERVIRLGFFTLTRVLALLLLASLVWTPVGVAIGFHPRLAALLQPLALFLASFPANFIFPFATLAFIRFGVPINGGSILLMALGSQWYILFNAIAGAASIPTDLREMADDIGLRGWNRWRRLVLPGIFSAWVTGAITASGGAWNASIVSEVVSWGATTLTASGLGAYIAAATSKGDWPRITLGVGVMSLYVVGANRLVWRRLYALAQRKYRL